MLSGWDGLNCQVPPGGIGPEVMSRCSNTTVTVSFEKFFHVTAWQQVDTSQCGRNPTLVMWIVKPLSKLGSGLIASWAACVETDGGVRSGAPPLPVSPSHAAASVTTRPAPTRAQSRSFDVTACPAVLGRGW